MNELIANIIVKTNDIKQLSSYCLMVRKKIAEKEIRRGLLQSILLVGYSHNRRTVGRI